MYGANNAGCDEVSGGASLPYDRQFIIGTVRATASERLWRDWIQVTHQRSMRQTGVSFLPANEKLWVMVDARTKVDDCLLASKACLWMFVNY